MREAARNFMIDLVAISSHLRIAVFNGKKAHMYDIAKSTGLTVERIELVLVKALTSDFRDQQLELLASQIVFSDGAKYARNNQEALLFEVPYPPLWIIHALTNTAYATLEKCHEVPQSRSMIRSFMDAQFTQAVFEWVESNIDNAVSVGMDILAEQDSVFHEVPMQEGAFPLESSGRGLGFTAESVRATIAKYMGMKSDDVNIQVM
jgi:hypothetical protein